MQQLTSLTECATAASKIACVAEPRMPCSCSFLLWLLFNLLSVCRCLVSNVCNTVR